MISHNITDNAINMIHNAQESSQSDFLKEVSHDILKGV